MKQDPKDQNSKDMAKRDSDDVSNAKSAMASYYDDLLGEITNDPLQQLNAQEMLPLSSVSSVPGEKETAKQKAKRKAPAAKTDYAERQPAAFMTPVVIPAAFPKFAPPEEEKRSVDTESKTESIREKLQKPIRVKAKDKLVSPPKPRVDQQDELPTSSSPEVTNTEQEALVKPEVVDDLQRAEITETQVIQEIEVKEPEEWMSNGRPVWAQDRFECLLFSVAGLKLAVPLISLGAIYQIENDFTPLVGRANWFMGLYRSQDRNIQVVDTAKWVMPDRYHDQVRDGYQYIIRLGGNNWGMACDAVHEAIQLDPSQVKWRSERSKRPWLSGTVIDHMCALLDADMLGFLLQRDARAH